MSTRGSIHKLRDDRWAVILSLGRWPDGRRRQSWHYVTGTWNDAEKERIKLVADLLRGTHVPPSKATIAQVLDQWLVNIRPQIRPSTWVRYAQSVRHLRNELGTIPVATLTLQRVRDYRNHALSQGSSRGGPLAPKTVKENLVVLSCALDDVVGTHITQNPIARVGGRRSRHPVLPRVEQVEQRVLDDDEVNRLLAAARGTYLELPIRLDIDTGLRRGELLGAELGDIELEWRPPQLSVVRQRGGPTKSRASVRTIPLSPETSELLRARYASHLSECAKASHARCPLLPPGPRGSRHATTFTNNFLYFAQTRGFDEVTWHTLRHTFASRQILAGVNVKTVQYWLGHSDPATTLRIYAHIFDRIAGHRQASHKRAL